MTLRCFEIFELFLCLNWRLCPKVYCFVQQQFTFDRQLLLAAEQPVHLARLNSKLFSLGEYVLSLV